MMTSRDKILTAVAANQPAMVSAPRIPDFSLEGDLIDIFIKSAEGIGSSVVRISDLGRAAQIVNETYAPSRVLSLIPELGLPGFSDVEARPHSFEDVKIAVVKGHFGVAENSAIWITESLLGQRVLPFIAEHLAIVINITDIVPTMHQAYQRIGDQIYGYGAFIAGPSKTADIEQSLVRGAHGPRSLTVFLLEQ